MTIIEALVRLRNDLKLWVANNLRTKVDKDTLGVADGVATLDNAGKVPVAQIPTYEHLHPETQTQTSGSLQMQKVDFDDYGHVISTSLVTKADITALGIPSTNTTYSVVTETSDGLMSHSDKKKMNIVQSMKDDLSLILECQSLLPADTLRTNFDDNGAYYLRKFDAASSYCGTNISNYLNSFIEISASPYSEKSQDTFDVVVTNNSPLALYCIYELEALYFSDAHQATQTRTETLNVVVPPKDTFSDRVVVSTSGNYDDASLRAYSGDMTHILFQPVVFDFTLDSSNRSRIGYNYDTTHLIIPALFQENNNWYSITTIENNAFDGCDSIEKVQINNGVVALNTAAFRDCTSLTDISIPRTVATLGANLFEGCYSLTRLYLFRTLVKNIPHDFAQGCTSLNSLVLPEVVDSIGDSAFHSCTNLSSVTFFKSLSSIGSHAFEDCTGLQHVEYAGTSSEWRSITKGQDWNTSTAFTSVYCRGDSTSVYYIDGTWTFNTTLTYKTLSQTVHFISDGTEYSSIAVDTVYGGCILFDGTEWAVDAGAWTDTAYRTINFTHKQEVSEEFYLWLVANATRNS